jgi:fumarate reductase flavoprotein subunit
MTAAIEAHDAGCSVVVLESQGVPGGNSVRSTGGMNAAPTVWQNQNDFNAGAAVEKTLASAEAYAETDPGAERIHELAAIVREQWNAYQESGEGYFDSEELFQLDTLLGGHGLNDASLVERLVKNSDNAIDWLATIGADLHNVGQFGGASVMRIHRPVDENGKVLSVGAYLVPILQKNVTLHCLALFFGIFNGTGGEITGSSLEYATCPATSILWHDSSFPSGKSILCKPSCFRGGRGSASPLFRSMSVCKSDLARIVS